MPESDETRREGITLAAIEPDGSVGEIQISFQRMQTVARRGFGHAAECGFLVPAVLQEPTAIFEGLRRDEDEDRYGYGWRCYCGLPDASYRADGTKAPPRFEQVFLVFVNDERVAYNWRWEKGDPDHEDLPMNHESCFKRRLL